MDENRSATKPRRPEEEAADIVIRLLGTTAEFDSCFTFQRRIWGDGFADAVPATLLQISQKVGGIAAGAFVDGGTRLVGFVFGLTGFLNGRPCHWSHMLGVLPEQRGRRIGQRLKHFQRRHVRELGIGEMRWSFDPLIAGNAHFNLNLLRVEIDSYEPEMYGDTGSALHSFGTDRFVARWDLGAGDGRSDGKRKRADPVSPEVLESIPVANVIPGRTGAARQARGDRTAQRIRIEIPKDILEIQRSDPDLALEWRHSTRTAFTRSIMAGYRVAGFTRVPGSGRCAYLLERGSEPAGRSGV